MHCRMLYIQIFTVRQVEQRWNGLCSFIPKPKSDSFSVDQIAAMSMSFLQLEGEFVALFCHWTTLHRHCFQPQQDLWCVSPTPVYGISPSARSTFPQWSIPDDGRIASSHPVLCLVFGIVTNWSHPSSLWEMLTDPLTFVQNNFLCTFQLWDWSWICYSSHFLPVLF